MLEVQIHLEDDINPDGMPATLTFKDAYVCKVCSGVFVAKPFVAQEACGCSICTDILRKYPEGTKLCLNCFSHYVNRQTRGLYEHW